MGRGRRGAVVRWDAFFGRKKEARDREREKIQGLIRRIERTAPRVHHRDRAARYYHYAQIRAYVRPLRVLLEAVADTETLAQDEGAAVRELYRRLLGFYDVRGRLSLDEAVGDVRLRRKLSDLMVLFYGRRGVRGDRLSGMLEPLRERGDGDRS